MVLVTPGSKADLLREEASRVGEGLGVEKAPTLLPMTSARSPAQHFQLGFLVAAVQSFPSVPGPNKGPFDEKCKSQ